MAQTEAAALLQTGAIYPRRIGLRSDDGALIFVGVKRGAFSIYFDDAPIYHFDLEGRWQRAYVDGVHYRKALDNSVDSLDRVREGENLVLKRRALGFAEIADLDEAIRQVAVDLRERIGIGSFRLFPLPQAISPLSTDELDGLLDRVGLWDAPAQFTHRERFLAAYGPNTIFVPPDAQNAIVLQATAETGFFRTPAEFAHHARDVAELLGRRSIAASGVFLADAAALYRPIGDLNAYLDTIAATFPLSDNSSPKRPQDRPIDRPDLKGIDISWRSGISREPLPNREGWRSLAAKRVKRLIVRLPEEANDAEASRVSSDARSAGIPVTILVTFGIVDGESVERLARRVESLTPGARDLVTLIDAGASDSSADTAGQRDALKALLAPSRARGAIVSVYNPEKQWS